MHVKKRIVYVDIFMSFLLLSMCIYITNNNVLVDFGIIQSSSADELSESHPLSSISFL